MVNNSNRNANINHVTQMGIMINTPARIYFLADDMMEYMFSQTPAFEWYGYYLNLENMRYKRRVVKGG